MSDASKPSLRPRHVLLAAAALVLAAAGAGVTVFGASAQTLAVETSANAGANANVQLNANDPLVQAAAGAKEVAESAGLKTAVGGAWKVAWDKSWPFIKSMVLKFFGLFGQAWRAIVSSFKGPATNANANVAVNAAVNANVAVNAATNAP